MKSFMNVAIAILTFAVAGWSATFYVAPSGRDANPGTQAAPFRTIQHAADLAQAGDVITVEAGVYREQVSPPRGGESNAKRIVYQAAPGAKVVITGSETVKNWMRVRGDVWKVTLPNSFFGGFNPYRDVIHGDWFGPKGWVHHTGAVYLNGDWLMEAPSLDQVMGPIGDIPLWYSQVDNQKTTIWAQFNGVNPNRQHVEINVRQSVFYPRKTGINYITVRGFTLEDAATPWSPPTAEQIGLIGTNWSKGWVIENNTIAYSRCACVTLGKYGDRWDNTSANTAEGYVRTVERALGHGWTRENIGHHIVRDNTISHCGQAGVVGSLGAVFSTITGNTIHDIHVRPEFGGAEMAGIKIHAAIDVLIAHNHVYRAERGIWLDWMGQGTRVSSNLLNDNPADVVVEVDHGPFLVDNNLLLSPTSLRDLSQGGAYVHNLFAGIIKLFPYDSRQTPFLKPHSTQIGGFHDNPNGDDRFYNNLFVDGADLSVYDHAPLPMAMDGNVYLKGAKPSRFEKNPIVEPDFDPAIKLVKEAGGLYLEMKYDPAWITERARQLVTSQMLGRAVIPNAAFEQPDGKPIRISTDYFGRTRNTSNPAPGPFASPQESALKLKVRSKVRF